MRLLKALVMGIAIMMISQAATADICTTVGSTITCQNGAQNYTRWKVGKSSASNEVFACAYYSSAWHLVGRELIGTATNLVMNGGSVGENLSIVDTTGVCDTSASLNVVILPSNWFTSISAFGNRGDDTITGSYRNENIEGNGGSDTLNGRAGVDTIYGGALVDFIYGGPGDDNLHGDGGDDIIEGDTGDDDIWGEDGADTINGNAGDDDIWGGDGIDTLYGDEGADDIWGCNDRDTMYGGAGDDILDGITYETSVAYDFIYGNDGDDILSDNGAGVCDGGDHTTSPYDGCSCPDVAEVNCEY